MSLGWTEKMPTEDEESNIQKMTINYKGNKNYRGQTKGKYSEMPWVLHKNLMRSLKRYLKEQFKFFCTELPCKSKNFIKRSRINLFYNEHLKNHSLYAKKMNESEELGVLHILSSFLQQKVNYRNDTKEFKLFKTRLNKMTKMYSHILFDSITVIPEFKMFAVILKESGVLDKMINLYPILAKCKHAHEMAVEKIIGSIIDEIQQ